MTNKLKHSFLLSGVILVLIWLSGCFQSKTSAANQQLNTDSEAREDSIKLKKAYAAQSQFTTIIYPVSETDPVKALTGDDAADDPAIWLNELYPDSSLIFGTDKKSGIYAYNLSGNEMAYYPVGKINNIDIRQKIKVGEQSIDVLGGSNRSDNSMVLYQIDAQGKMQRLLKNNQVIDTTDIDEVYGFCMYKDAEQHGYVLINGKNGKVSQYLITANPENEVTLEFIFQWQLESQPEGMVADDELGMLYIGEEERGIWKISLVEEGQQLTLLPQSEQTVNEFITYDIEGLALYQGENQSGFLLVSMQGSFSYALFDRITNEYLGSFIIKEKGKVDGVEETDGLEIFSKSIGAKFPHGLVVVQDGFNFQNGEMVSQNYKLLDLKDVISAVESFREIQP